MCKAARNPLRKASLASPASCRWKRLLIAGQRGIPVALHDVAAMMALLKVARIRHSPDKRDSWCDLAGYAACGFDVATLAADSP